MSDSPKLLDWRSGGGLLLASGLLVVAVVGWRVIPLLRQDGRAAGGRVVEDYEFDVGGALVPADSIVPSGLPRDGIPTLDYPSTLPSGQVGAFNDQHRGKYLVSSDRVIGVALGDEVRTYPIRVMNWHEVVNDTVGGVPVAVTYSPLCDSVAVFDRRVGGETLEFGVSGLLFNSNLLLYDRREPAVASSLWSQLQARAITGPAAKAGRRLTVLPASLARWDHWIRRHPSATVVRPEPLRFERYRRDPYGSYLATGKPRFPVEPMPPAGSRKIMSPMLIVQDGAAEPIQLDSPEDANRLRRTAARYAIQIDPADPTPSILVSPETPGTIYTRWFAWYAQH